MHEPRRAIDARRLLDNLRDRLLDGSILILVATVLVLLATFARVH